MINHVDAFEHTVQPIDVAYVGDVAQRSRRFQIFIRHLRIDFLFEEKDLRFVVIDDSDFRGILSHDLSHKFATNRTATTGDEDCFASEKCHCESFRCQFFHHGGTENTEIHAGLSVLRASVVSNQLSRSITVESGVYDSGHRVHVQAAAEMRVDLVKGIDAS